MVNQHPSVKAPASATLFYVWVVVALSISAMWFRAWSTDWVMPVLVTLSSLLFLESMILYFRQHRTAWKNLLLLLLMTLALLTLTGIV